MSIRVRAKGDVTLTGGDLSVDVIHTEDSVSLGDGTNTMTLQDVGGVKSVPVKVTSTTTDAVLTGGSQRSKITDGTDNVEIDDVGGEKALKVSVISTVGGMGEGGTAATDSSTYTATASMFTPIGGAMDDTSSDALSEGEMGMVRMTSARAMHVYIAGQAGGASGLTDSELRATPVPVSVSGVATAANQTTMIGHLDGVEGLLGTIDADTGNISTKIDTIAGAVSGTEMQVDIVTSALPSGAATSAKQDTIIGHVDGIETLIGSTNTKLDSVISGVDGLEALIGTTNTNTGSIVTSVQLLDDVVATVASAIPTKGYAVAGTDGTNARILKTDSSGELQIDVVSSALPSGAASEATLSSIKTSVETIDNAISGNEMQVDVITLPSLPTGGNIIGKVAIADGDGDSCMDDVNAALRVNIVAGASSGGTAMADDAAFTAGTTQVTPIGAVYQGTPDTVNDGDVGAPRMTQSRVLMTEIQNASVAVTGTFWQATQPVSGTVSVTGVATDAKLDTIITHVDGLEGLIGTTNTKLDTVITSVQLIDDAIFTDDAAFTPATSKGIMMMAQADETSADSVDEGDAGALRMTLTRFLKTELSGVASGVAIPITDNSGSLTVDGTVAATQSGTWNIGSITTLPSIPAGTNNIGDVDVLSLPALPAGTNNIGDVDVLTLPGVAGTAAHDAGVSGNPVRIGGRAMLANGTAVAEDDTVDIACDNQGRVLSTLHVPRDLTTQGNITLTNTTETTVIAAGGAGVFHDLTKIILTNSSSTAVRVQIRDTNTPGGTIRLEVALAANGGAVIDFGAVPMCQTTANNAWSATLSGSVTSVYVYYQAIKRIA